MRLISHSTPHAPCFYIRFRSTRILFDCGSSHELPSTAASAPRSSLPIVQQDVLPESTTLDAVLVTSAWPLLALPFWLAGSPRQCPVYCTEVVLQIAKQLFKEALASGSGVRTWACHEDGQDASSEQQQQQQQQQQEGASIPATAAGVGSWQQQVANFLAVVQVVRYGQRVEVGSEGVVAEAQPSGSGLGHAVWVLVDGEHRVAVAQQLSLEATAAAPLNADALRNLDALVLGPQCFPDPNPTPAPSTSTNPTPPDHPPTLSLHPTTPRTNTSPILSRQPPPIPIPSAPRHHPHPPPTSRQALWEACRAAAAAVAAGGNVLMALDLTGEAFELIEALSHTFRMLGGTPPLCPLGPSWLSSPLAHPQGPSGPGGAPPPAPLMAFLCPAAKEHLGLGTISMEWLATARQLKVYSAEPPFDHEYLLQEGGLVVAPSLEDKKVWDTWREPCIAMVSASSLLQGTGHELLSRWQSSPRNLLIVLTAHPSHTPALQALQPSPLHHPPQMAVLHLPLQPAPPPPPHQLGTLLAHLAPRTVLLPAGCSVPGIPRRQDLQDTIDPAVSQVPLRSWRGATEAVAFHALQEVRLKLPPSFLAATVAPELAARVELATLAPGVMAGKLSAMLLKKEGSWWLEPAPKGHEAGGPAGQHLEHHQQQQQQQQQLVWGRVDAQQLCDALQAAGHEDAAIARQRLPGDPEEAAAVEVVSVPSLNAVVRLLPHATEVVAGAGAALEQVNNLLLQQLNVL